MEAWNKIVEDKNQAAKAAAMAKAALEAKAKERRAVECESAFRQWRKDVGRRKFQAERPMDPPAESARRRGVEAKEAWRDRDWREKNSVKTTKKEHPESKPHLRAFATHALLRRQFLRWRCAVAYEKWIKKKAQERKLRVPGPVDRRAAAAARERRLWRRQEWRRMKDVVFLDVVLKPPNRREDKALQWYRRREQGWRDVV